MRSGKTTWRAPERLPTPSISTIGLPRALDPRAHLDETIGKIDDLRLARRVDEKRMAFGEGSGHERGMGAADRHLGKMDLGAGQPLRRLGMDIARLDLDLRPELFENHDEKIDRPCADRAATREGNLGLPHPREKRCDDPETRPHFRDELIGSRRVDDLARAEVKCPARMRGGARLPAIDRVIGAMMTENAQKQADIGEIRDIFEGQSFFCEKRRNHQRQGRVFGAGNPYDAIKFLAADDTNPIQQIPLFKKFRNSLVEL